MKRPRLKSLICLTLFLIGTMANADLDIGYVTDIEGSMNYLNEYVSRKNSVLGFNSTGHLEFKKDGTHFVFGGDLPDRGEYSLRITHLLMDLHARHPDRVQLILGNRDINKLRLVSELKAYEGQLVLRTDLRADKKIWATDFNGWATENLGKALLPASDFISVEGVYRPATQAALLRYIFKSTMGAPDAFEFRRTELAAIKDLSSPTLLSDADVVSSFLEELGVVEPN